jgi:hypothetical protein
MQGARVGAQDQQEQSPAGADGGRGRLCRVYWCRAAAAVVVQLDEQHYGFCRTHAEFVKIGKLDWFER